jgi:fructokinase
MKALPTVVCIGEALTDMEHSSPSIWRSHVGGSTWNVARALAKLNIPTAFAGSISQDNFGQALWDASVVAQLDMRFIQRYAKSPLLAIVESQPAPHYYFIGDDSADLYFDPTQLPQGWKAAAQWAHFGGISLARQPLAERLIRLAYELKQVGVKISYDPNFRNLMDEKYHFTLVRMCAIADVIKVSDEDCRGLFSCDDAQEGFTQLRQYNPDALYFYTAGAAGGSLYLHDQVWNADTAAIDVVDSIGAGDASIAGLLYSLVNHPQHEYAQHLAFALASGSAACLHAGAQAPSLQEIQSLTPTTPTHQDQ